MTKKLILKKLINTIKLLLKLVIINIIFKNTNIILKNMFIINF